MVLQISWYYCHLIGNIVHRESAKAYESSAFVTSEGKLGKPQDGDANFSRLGTGASKGTTTLVFCVMSAQLILIRLIYDVPSPVTAIACTSPVVPEKLWRQPFNRVGILLISLCYQSAVYAPKCLAIAISKIIF